MQKTAVFNKHRRYKNKILIFFFTVVPCILMLSCLLFIQLNAQLDCSNGMLKLALKFTLKCSYMFWLHDHHQGAYCLCFAQTVSSLMMVV